MIVEILDRRGHVASRSRLDELPATIGRAYHNTVIVDDRYVSPEHVRVERDEHGLPVALDVGSLNGIYIVGQPRPHAAVRLGPGVAIRIGRTVLRFRDPDEPVPPAVPDTRRRPELLQLLESPRTRWVIVGTTVALYGADTYASSTARVGAAEVGSTVLGILLALVAWAGLWAFVSRVTTQRFAFHGHLAWVCAVAVLGLAFGWLTDYAEFLSPASTTREVLSVAGWAMLGVLLLYGHLGLTSSLSPPVRVAASLSVAAALLVLVGLLAYAESEDFSPATDYSPTLKPIAVSLVPTMSLDRFFERARTLRGEVDEMLEE